jgi:excisionase family DNA binding protein
MMEINIDGVPHITTNEAVDLMGCTEGWVRKLLRAGKIQGKKIGERCWLVPLAEVEEARKELTTRSVGKRGAALPEAPQGEMLDGVIYLNVTEAADFMGCTVGWVRKLLLDGKIPGRKLGKRLWLIPLPVLAETRKTLSSRSVGKRQGHKTAAPAFPPQKVVLSERFQGIAQPPTAEPKTKKKPRPPR